ncbi:MAG TPA: hypothetical protein EYH37_01900 [Aquifex aeolicus]|uniref:Uncharacterized protein n=1 Tax=Aquifex aeolicus TaxID=63363 RepID=A0A9D1CG40_AQUAO|nr:hypothetical protein [Aquifex aeolicus]
MLNKQLFSKRELLNTYYLGSKLSTLALFLLILFLKNEYGGEENFRYFLVFIALAYLLGNILWVSFNKNLFSNLWIRVLDYSFGLFIIFLSNSLYGILPAVIILSTYSAVFFEESLIALGVYWVALLINAILLEKLTSTDFAVGVLFLISYFLVSTKYNIITLVKEQKKALKNLKDDLQKLDKTISILSLEKKHYEEVLSVVEVISEKEYLENLPEILKNMLKAEDVKIRRKSPFSTVTREGYVTVSLRDMLLMVKPREKYLMRDRGYKEKLQLLLKVLRPYIESFLAKRR